MAGVKYRAELRLEAIGEGYAAPNSELLPMAPWLKSKPGTEVIVEVEGDVPEITELQVKPEVFKQVF